MNTYSLETTVAEKLDAILSLMEFSSRLKDYYDLYYLANKFDFDGATLTEALKRTFENRGHHFTVEQFEQVMAFGDDNAMQKKWKAFCRKIDTKTDDYCTVLRMIKTFLMNPLWRQLKAKNLLNNGRQKKQNGCKGDLTWDEINIVLELLPDATPFFSVKDDEIIQIINEEAGAYYSGQKGVDDVVGVIQNRVQLYVDENKESIRH